VLAIFKDLRVDKRLSLIMEGESLLNDGTAAVLFEILLGAAVADGLSVPKGIGLYFLGVGGGATLGAALGYLASRVTETLDDPEIEITLTTILAYGSYLLAYRLHLSGVIAAASAGLVLGNLGAKKGMSSRTQTAMQSFWEYISFVMNSVVFLLIGLEIHIRELLSNWSLVLLAIGAVLLGRVLSVYLVIPVSNRFTAKIPLRWQHVIVWGGLRGALALGSRPKLGRHVSLSGANPEFDVRSGHLLNSCPRPDIEALSANPPHCPCQSRNPITSGTCAAAIGRYEMGARLPALPRQQNF